MKEEEEVVEVEVEEEEEEEEAVEEAVVGVARYIRGRTGGGAWLGPTSPFDSYHVHRVTPSRRLVFTPIRVYLVVDVLVLWCVDADWINVCAAIGTTKHYMCEERGRQSVSAQNTE